MLLGKLCTEFSVILMVLGREKANNRAGEHENFDCTTLLLVKERGKALTLNDGIISLSSHA